MRVLHNILGFAAGLTIGVASFGCQSATDLPAGPPAHARGDWTSTSSSVDMAGRALVAPIAPWNATFQAPSSGGATRSWLSPDFGTLPSRLLYISDWYKSGVLIYSQYPHHRVVGFIDTSPYQPNSVHVDAVDDLWVALNTSGPDGTPSVYVYHRGQTTPYRVLTGIPQIPVNVAVGSDGTAYVTDEDNGSGSGANVTVYAPGSNTPTSKLSVPNGTCCGWVAANRHGDVFLTYESPVGHTGEVVEFRPGSTRPRNLGITLTTFPGGIEVLGDGSLLVSEQGIPENNLTARVDTFPKGATQPSSVIYGNPSCDQWVGPALNRDKTVLYVGSTILASQYCASQFQNFGVVEAYSYPSGTPLITFSNGLVNQPGWTLLFPATDPPVADQ